jgi:hypothetical protein
VTQPPAPGRALPLGLLAIGLALFLDRLATWVGSEAPISVPALGGAVAGGLLLLGFALLARAARGGPRTNSPAPADDRVDAIARAVEGLADRLAAGDRQADERRVAVAEIRLAMDEGRLEVATRLVDRFRADHPDAAQGEALANELSSALLTRVAEVRSRLDASRAAGDADRVMDLRDELGPLLSPDQRGDLDRETLTWVMLLIQKRLRAGTVRGDVAALAARVADRFGDTVEGASLRASLPTLRRSAGLCPRCARPYTGSGDSCPACRAAGSAPA